MVQARSASFHFLIMVPPIIHVVNGVQLKLMMMENWHPFIIMDFAAMVVSVSTSKRALLSLAQFETCSLDIDIFIIFHRAN